MGFAALVVCAALAFVGAAPGHAADGWSERELAVLRSLWVGSLGPVPPQPSNRWADDPGAAAFGRSLFFETKLSRDGTLSCASCHEPDLMLTDGRQFGHGLGDAQRNTPSLFGAAYYPWLYWDGRRDSLWAQALTPMEAQNEMGSTRSGIVRQMLLDPALRSQYEAVFGPVPDDQRQAVAHLEGGPFGTPEQKAAWSRAPAAAREAANSIFANVGKALAAYERTLPVEPTRFDAFVASLLEDHVPQDGAALSPEEEAGLRLFIDDGRARCLRCHNGPLLSNYDFHNVGTGTFEGKHMDFGRVFGVRSALIDEFNCMGPYSDALPDQCLELRFIGKDDHTGAIAGAFKVPGLRNVALTAPYMHDGRYGSLREVIEHYRHPDNPTTDGHELLPVDISDEEAAQLEAFLKTLTALRPTPPAASKEP